MAQFRGTIAGQRGEASRLGSKKSGLIVNANAWNVGVKVVARHNREGEDVFDIFSTEGSNGGDVAYIGTVRGKLGGGITFDNRSVE